jgi:hypothetical protein
MLCKAKVVVRSENTQKEREQHVKFLNVKPGST